LRKNFSNTLKKREKKLSPDWEAYAKEHLCMQLAKLSAQEEADEYHFFLGWVYLSLYALDQSLCSASVSGLESTLSLIRGPVQCCCLMLLLSLPPLLLLVGLLPAPG
jgi:hypothetical protein